MTLHSNKNMLSPEDKRAAMQRVEVLRKQKPNIKPEHFARAKEMLKETQRFEEAKDRDIACERQALAKDVAGFVHNQYVGVGQVFNGFGPGKRHDCEICREHHSTMFHTKDGRWYCAEHRWFGDLTQEQQQKERRCLSTKQSKR